MAKISSFKWILCGYQLTFIVKNKMHFKMIQINQITFDEFSIQKKKKWKSFQLKVICARIKSFWETTDILEINQIWLGIKCSICKLQFVCMGLFVERGRQNLNIASSITVTVYSYLNLTFFKRRFRLGVIHQPSSSTHCISSLNTNFINFKIEIKSLAIYVNSNTKFLNLNEFRTKPK